MQRRQFVHGAMAVVDGISAAASAWRVWTKESRRRRIGSAMSIAFQWQYLAARGLGLSSTTQPEPPFDLRQRASLSVGAIWGLFFCGMGWLLLPASAEDRQVAEREWEEQRERYKEFARALKRRTDWTDPRLWSSLDAPWKTPVDRQTRRLAMAFALLSGLGAAAGSWRWSHESGKPQGGYCVWLLYKLLALLFMTGMTPSTSWLPRWLRQTGRVLLAAFLVPVTLWALINVGVRFSEAFASDEQLQAKYEESQRMLRELDEQRAREQAQQSPKRWWEFWRED